MSKINIFELDNLDNQKDEVIINKPETYQELLKYLSNKNKLYEIFIYENNNKIIINNEDNYKIIKDILFIKEMDINYLEKSIFSINYDKLSESNQEILDEKFNCNICSTIIKNEKPYLCYQCQKIFHEKCLKDWDNKCKSQNKNLECPNCRNILPLENWNKKLDYEDNRIDNANLLNKINEYELNNNMNNNINIIKDKKIKEYEDFINETILIFKNILNKINKIHNTLKMKNNIKLNELINNYNLNINNLNTNDISKIINEELNSINENLSNNKNNKLNEKEFYKNEIKIIYYAQNNGEFKIFGDKFVDNNKDKIELTINDKNNKLVDKYELRGGDNIIKLLIKNKLTNLSYMFYECNNLKDIKELKYLNVAEIKDLSYMFCGCSLLSNIKSLENWNVSKCEDFSYMFSGCSSLSNIKPLENWNVSNGSNFSYLFWKCSSLSDINPLNNWNVSSCNDFSYMFYRCSSLSDIKPLEKWNTSSSNDFSYMFYKCSSISDIKPLKSWNVSNCNNFSYMFSGCSSLSDIKPLENWNVSNCNNFNFMFSRCPSLSNIKPLQNWKGFKNMFDNDKYH